jgi:hypothetical protein
MEGVCLPWHEVALSDKISLNGCEDCLASDDAVLSHRCAERWAMMSDVIDDGNPVVIADAYEFIALAHAEGAYWVRGLGVTTSDSREWAKVNGLGSACARAHLEIAFHARSIAQMCDEPFWRASR